MSSEATGPSPLRSARTNCRCRPPVHRLLFGGWRAEARYAWACLHGQKPDEVPAATAEPDLFSMVDDAPEAPVLGAAAAL